LRTVLGNAQAVLAIELLVAAQAVDWRVGMQRDPNTPAAARSGAEESVAFDAATKPERRAAIAALLGRGTGAAYLALRRVAEPMLAARMLEPDIRAVRRIIDNGTLLAAVNARLETPLRGIPALERPHT